MSDETQVSPCGDDLCFMPAKPARRRRRRLQHNAASFAWRLTVASRRFTPKAPVRLHKRTG